MACRSAASSSTWTAAPCRTRSSGAAAWCRSRIAGCRRRGARVRFARSSRKEEGEDMPEPSCIFCKIAAGEIESNIVYRDERIVAFRDLNPQAPTHVLVIPRKHVATINDLGAEDAETAGRLFLVAAEVAKSEGVDESGYRVVMNCGEGAGQSVFHIHLHVLGGRAFRWPPG